MNIYNLNDISGLGCNSAVTVGMFDGVHVGHRQMVSHLADKACQQGLKPVVLTFRNHPRSVLRPTEAMPLLTTFDERMELLERCGAECVVAMQFDEQTAHLSACQFASRILVERLGMKLLLLGYDNKFGSRQDDDFHFLPELGLTLGFTIHHDQPVKVEGIEVSSTKIRKALLDGNLQLANLMLGEPYSLTGTVVKGRHVGTALGFPTANVELTETPKLLPPDGVYAMSVEMDGKPFAAMGNLGGQPTFGLSQRTLEVNIIDFDRPLYGETIHVSFLKRLRDVMCFDSEEELKSQLNRDRQETILALNH